MIQVSDPKKGFLALVAVILLATGTLAFSLGIVSASAEYADAVLRRELRIQADLFARACLDSVTLMAAKDYFISGTISLREFGCLADVTNDFNGNIGINAFSTVQGVGFRAARSVRL